jgi:hypothetical protein
MSKKMTTVILIMIGIYRNNKNMITRKGIIIILIVITGAMVR